MPSNNTTDKSILASKQTKKTDDFYSKSQGEQRGGLYTSEEITIEKTYTKKDAFLRLACLVTNWVTATQVGDNQSEYNRLKEFLWINYI